MVPQRQGCGAGVRWGTFSHRVGSTYKLVEHSFDSELSFPSFLSWEPFYFDTKSLMQSTGALALNGLSSSPECTEILAVDQLRVAQGRGHVVQQKLLMAK